jgi:hypothetical protein
LQRLLQIDLVGGEELRRILPVLVIELRSGLEVVPHLFNIEPVKLETSILSGIRFLSR